MAIIKVRNPAIDLDAAEIPNLDASKITTGSFDASRIGSGTFADARIAASSVNQHATSFDDNKLVNDISTLALRQASDENKSAYNTNSSSVDVFQDATGIDTTTNTSRNASEYVDTKVTQVNTHSNGSTTFTDGSGNHTLSSGNNAVWTNGGYTGGGALGGSVGINFNNGNTTGYVNAPNTDSFIHQLGTSNFTIEGFYSTINNESNHRALFGYSDGSYQAIQAATNPTNQIEVWASSDDANWNILNGQDIIASSPGFSTAGTWTHWAICRNGSNWEFFHNGSRTSNTTGGASLSDVDSDFRIGAQGNVPNAWSALQDQFCISDIARYSGTSYTVPSGTNGTIVDSNHKLVVASKWTAETTQATGNFTSTTITAPSSISSMGAIITYQDNAGTNALNTDIVLQLSADGGSNYSTATLTALPDFSTGIKMAKVNDLSVTAGTSLKYKISFANQASGSKEARIRGVSLQY